MTVFNDTIATAFNFGTLAPGSASIGLSEPPWDVDSDETLLLGGSPVGVCWVKFTIPTQQWMAFSFFWAPVSGGFADPASHGSVSINAFSPVNGSTATSAAGLVSASFGGSGLTGAGTFQLAGVMAAGTYYISLAISDATAVNAAVAAGLSPTLQMYVQDNRPVNVTLSHTGPALAGITVITTTVHITASNFGEIVNSLGEFSGTLDWGDGQTTDLSSLVDGKTYTHVYSLPSSGVGYAVTATVHDVFTGLQSVGTDVIVVFPDNPSIVSFTVLPASGSAPLTVTAHLTPELWAAPLINAVIAWGTTDSDNTVIDLSTWSSGEVQATHTYTTPDTYFVDGRVNYDAVAGIDTFGRSVFSGGVDVVVSGPNLAGAIGDISAYFSPGRSA